MLLEWVPAPCERALDVGCGGGLFARRLAGLADHVDALDRDPAAIARAHRLAADIPNLRVIEADFLSWEPPGPTRYDFVSMIASLHHLPFDDTLTKAVGLLRDGGGLAVLGLDRASSAWSMIVRSSVAFPVSRLYRLTRGRDRVGAPVTDPTMTLREICDRAGALLPGAVVRRHLFWRYSLRWIKPAPATSR
jgi:SAM-dependent methyltransferase